MSKTDDLLDKADEQLQKTNELLGLVDRILTAILQLPAPSPPGPGDPGQLHAIVATLDHVLAEQRAIRRLILALTQNEQQAVNDLSSAVETLASDLGDVLSAAQAAVVDLNAQIAALSANDAADAAQIAALQAVVTDMETDVIGALTPVTERVNAIDTGLKSPASPDAPLTAKG